MKLLSQALQENSSLREIVMTGNKLETAGKTWLRYRKTRLVLIHTG